ncbi:hypothetical protein HBH56_218510 [Parastagonospora nodorum]|uniref:Secreted protein n=1 Tax=Phaeosphaeria nodorum (strain SN15 / ATCC MYA-4574 / FGSC 10173) TaxID=321614 RepID=A0A7U2NP40_PHANO|nr:hypothetical protein HBH56_218510 [Parastagonospora nodorum]QRD05401.1 hypothetical protein JI435_422410 [Parastagonospora nodorum SN15]KAH3922719.1 hypothetical protein HBH54_220370 [Parastagonospora nodorum]KAH4082302.1 hypothetical protein HBH46_221960 [Parastagonospora nodorum]KAH4124689.1 hypothetical protein HBH45_234590 [Parastagonospora nodorum]
MPLHLLVFTFRLGTQLRHTEGQPQTHSTRDRCTCYTSDTASTSTACEVELLCATVIIRPGKPPVEKNDTDQ